MSPLARYDVAQTVSLIAAAGVVITRAPVFDVMVVVAFAYMLLARCPSCGSRLARNRKKWIHPLCAKTCLKCGHDLTKR
jgi:hypothetical protein